MFSTPKVVSITAALLALASTTAGCASHSPTPSAPAAVAAGVTDSPVDVVLVDCSPSFRPAASSYLDDMIAVARDSARQKRSLWAGCFDGAPLRTLRWTIKTDFGTQPKGITPQVAERLNQARALGLRHRLAVMIDSTPTRVSGSGLLEAFEVASNITDLQRVFLFTDALSNEVDGLKLATASSQQIQTTATRWHPRLGNGLRDVQVDMVGVGRGAHRSVSVRNARALFSQLVTGAGGRLSWEQTLSGSELAATTEG